MNLFTELVIRIVLIIVITDTVIFFVINSRKLEITVPLVISIIIVTIIPLIINIWFPLHQNGII